MNHNLNLSLKASNGLSNIDDERFDGGSALDWNNSKFHLQNIFQATECWDYVNLFNPIPEDIDLVIENTFNEPEPNYSIMATDRITLLNNVINNRLNEKENNLAVIHLAPNALEAYLNNSERSSELAKLEPSRDSCEKNFLSSRDAWQKRKERHLYLQSKCMRVFVNNLRGNFQIYHLNHSV